MFCPLDYCSLKKDHEPIAFARSIRGFFTPRRVTLGKPAHQNAYQLPMLIDTPRHVRTNHMKSTANVVLQVSLAVAVALIASSESVSRSSSATIEHQSLKQHPGSVAA